jgi:hypothetical protein
MRIAAFMMSCPERLTVRERTLKDLQATDWSAPVTVLVDETNLDRRQARQEHTALRLLENAAAAPVDHVLFLEDDLIFNRYLQHNIEFWSPLLEVRTGEHFFGSLYNPTILARHINPGQAYFIADPDAVYGSQAILLSHATVCYLTSHWWEVPGMQDIKMSRLTARLTALHYHFPSLVQHVGQQSVWGGHFHSAPDFDPTWHE